MVLKPEVSSASTWEWIKLSLLMYINSERNNTVDEIYHTRWDSSKSFILKRTGTQKGNTGANESLAAVKNHRP